MTVRQRATTVLRNARRLLTLATAETDPLGTIADAAVGIANGQILWVGRESELERHVEIAPDATFVDADKGLVTPGLIDAHTHPIFAGQRSAEFALRAQGKPYADILAAGGGIHNTVRATTAAAPNVLLGETLARLDRMLAWGTTSCEGKSGYALELDGERRLLELLEQSDLSHPVTIDVTLLAHVVPTGIGRQEYVHRFAHELVPFAAERGLARSCDVYCDRGAFTLEETRLILSEAKRVGLGLRLHAEQLGWTGAASLGASLGARSVDHLEHATAEDIAALAAARTVAVLLPGAALNLRSPLPPARALLDRGVPVALATDCNPGSSMSESLPLQMWLGIAALRMTVEEAWQGVTVNAAKALDRPDLGRIVPGARADLCIFRCEEASYVPYHYGENHLGMVIKDGNVVLRR